MEEFKLFAGGEWIKTESGRVIEDINPADGSVCALVHTAGPKELEKAISAAVEAQKEWAKIGPEDKEKMLLKAADILEKSADKYALLFSQESGSVLMKARGEIVNSANIIRSAAGEIRRIPGGVIPAEGAGEFSCWIRQPLGVVAGISPFNFPVVLAITKAAYALAAGNAFILKPSSDTPVSGVIISEAFDGAGLPKGLFSCLPGKGSEIGDKLIEDPRIAMITFTGSTKVGRQLAVKAAQNRKRITLEMGGKNPMIVLKDADMDQAVNTALFGAYYHQGQVCMATGRIIVEEPVYDEFCEKFAARVRNLKWGNMSDPLNFIGPLIHEDHVAFLDELIKDAVDKGATLLCGGTHKGAFYEPSLLKDVTPEMRVFSEECFGPLPSIVKAKDPEDALRLCNMNDYGLTSALFTKDLILAMKMAPRMESGMVHVNDATVMGSRQAPFGGIKNSGQGREGGHFSIEDFTELKWIAVRYEKRGFPPM